MVIIFLFEKSNLNQTVDRIRQPKCVGASEEEDTLFIKAAYFYTSWAGKNVFNRPSGNQIKLQPKLNCRKNENLVKYWVCFLILG